jgi:hypothetical protein
MTQELTPGRLTPRTTRRCWASASPSSPREERRGKGAGDNLAVEGDLAD